MQNSPVSAAYFACLLRQADAGMPVVTICRGAGLSYATFHAWQREYADLDVGKIDEIELLREENGFLRRLVSEFMLDLHLRSEGLRRRAELGKAQAAIPSGTKPALCSSKQGGSPQEEDACESQVLLNFLRLPDGRSRQKVDNGRRRRSTD